MSLPSEPVPNRGLTEQLGQLVLMLDVIPIVSDTTISIVFISTAGSWRQGVWLGVDGEIDFGGARGSQFEVWEDTTPPTLEGRVIRTEDGLLRVYNIWDSGRGRHLESQSATSGMLKVDVDDHKTVYRCNDIGYEPTFDKLVFELRRS